MSGPDLNFRRCAREIITFTLEPPTSMTRILFFTASPISVLQLPLRPQPRSAPAGPHALSSSSHQAFSCVRAILGEIATAPADVALCLRALIADTSLPPAAPSPSRDR